MNPPGLAADVPSSARSEEAASRVESRLTEELARAGLALGSPVFIRTFKEPGTLELWIRNGGRFRHFKTYAICAFSGGLGPKLKEGDKQAPEGCYAVTPERMNPQSRFHLSFDLGYPNEFERYHKRTGSALMVHGDCVSIGCYAMGDAAIEEIWTLCSRALRNGQPAIAVHCFPFPMTRENLHRHAANEWIGFWRNLREIHDFFETRGMPPDVVVRDGKYAIRDPVDRQPDSPPPPSWTPTP
jgi:murein L,D-transpeptidase YafK